MALPSTPYTNTQLGGGIANYKVLTLSADIDADDTDILTTASPVAASWPDGTESDTLNNRISIQNEVISYTSITATGFHGCTRGEDGTTAAAHLEGTTVRQGPHADSYNRVTAYLADLATAAEAGKVLRAGKFYAGTPQNGHDILSWYFEDTANLTIVGYHINVQQAPTSNATLQLRTAVNGGGSAISITINAGTYDAANVAQSLTIASGNYLYLRTVAVNGLGNINCEPLYKYWF